MQDDDILKHKNSMVQVNLYFIRFIQQGSGDYKPVVVNRAVLRSMAKREVLIKCWPPPLTYQYFKNLMPEVTVAMCDSCFQVGIACEEDFERDPVFFILLFVSDVSCR